MNSIFVDLKSVPYRQRANFRMFSDAFFIIICSDINECEEANPCNQTCFNTEGSFQCTCGDCYDVVEETKCKLKDDHCWIDGICYSIGSISPDGCKVEVGNEINL